MVSSVTTAPYYSYLNQLTGATSAATTTPTSTTAAATATTPTTTSTPSSDTTASSLVSSLLNGGNSFSPEILTLLQQNSTGSFDPITTLLGGTGTNDALTSEYANLFASSAAAALTQSQDNNTSATAAAGTTSSSTTGTGTSTTYSAATESPVQSLIDGETQATVAYNNTLQQNAQSVITANSYLADGTQITA